MIGFDDVVRVLFQDVPRTGHDFVDDPRVDRRPVAGHLDRTPTNAHRAGEECPRGRAVAGFGQQNIDHLTMLIDSTVEVTLTGQRGSGCGRSFACAWGSSDNVVAIRATGR